jgi:hypothetical protein
MKTRVVFTLCLLYEIACTFAISPDMLRLQEQLRACILPDKLDPFFKSSLAPIDAAVPRLMANLNASGLWPDIQYIVRISNLFNLQNTCLSISMYVQVMLQDPDGRSEWTAAIHLRRCLELGVSQATPLSTHYQDLAVTAATKLCLSGWLKGGFVNSNWWWMQFGTLQLVAKLLLLAPDEDLLMQAQTNTFPRLTDADAAGFPGANRIWAAIIRVMVHLPPPPSSFYSLHHPSSSPPFNLPLRFATAFNLEFILVFQYVFVFTRIMMLLLQVGALTNNETLVDYAVSQAHAVYVVTQGDGIQSDRSFHQHGPLAYTAYGYGSHFMANALTLEVATVGTRWSMSTYFVHEKKNHVLFFC